MMKNGKRLGLTVLLSALALGAAACGGGSGGDDTITLKVADSLPTDHVFSREGIVPWMEEIEEKTDGRVEFEHYPAGQLVDADEMLSATSDGLTDIGYVVPSYFSDLLPLATVGELPGLYESGAAATVPYWKLITGELLDEFQEQGVRPLMTTVAPRYQPMLGSGTIDSHGDLQGAKLRSPGGAQDLAVKALGATPVSMAAPEVFESMQRGTVDGTVLPLDSIDGYGLTEILSAVTTNAPLGGTMTNMAINQETWEELPADIQDVFLEVAPDASQRAADAWESGSQEIVADLEEAGVEVVELSASEEKEWTEKLSVVVEQWQRAREGQGLPAADVLSEWKKLLADSGE